MRSFYSTEILKFPSYFVYMLQQVEYEPYKYATWLVRIIRSGQPFSSVMKRKSLVYTSRAKMLLLVIYTFLLVYVATVILILINVSIIWKILLVISLPVTATILTIFVLYVIAWCAHKLIVIPEHRKLTAQAREIFFQHKGVKIAVLGSYGKTTMKELLATLLIEERKVAATKGNMNVLVSHAGYAKQLTGDEDVLILEFGEGAPGDIEKMADMFRPDYAVITGLAPNHLDHYPDLAAVAEDLLNIYNFVDASQVYVNGDSVMLREYLPKNALCYTKEGLLDWSVSNVQLGISTLQFNLNRNNSLMHLQSSLIGAHQIGPIVAASVLAVNLGLSPKSIELGVANAVPYEHRMQPRFLQGAWLIDDTYNGNLEGMQAGLKYLHAIEAKRKWYVTPGLVDQGSETERVHNELGKAIANSQPDIVVLMDNSVRPIIQRAMESNGYKGNIIIEPDPLKFYTGLEHIIVAGDVVLMQNDWTDNYN